MSVSPGQLGGGQHQLGQKGMGNIDCQQTCGQVLVLTYARWVQGSSSMGILTGAILPRGQTSSQAAESPVAQCMLAWGTGAEPQDIQTLSSLGPSSPAEPASTRSSVGSREFPLPREETAPILSLAGAKDFDFFFFFFPAESKLTVPLQGRC